MWDLKIIDTDKSLYIAIVDALERDIRNGVLKAGEKLPPQRHLARKVGVNVTTITRAYKEAEKRGLVNAIIGSGTFISSDLGVSSSLINAEKKEKKLIEMGLVFPLYSMEPDISPIISKVLHKNNMNQFMTYTSPQGMYRHRLAGCEWMKRCGIYTDPDNIMVTAGAQHALNCIFHALFQPGDHVAVDCLTYPGVKTAAKLCGIQLEAVAMDEEGMTPRGLMTACKHHNLKGIYTVSALQNPTNAVMSEKRCEEITEIIRDNNLILIEDDLYRFFTTKSPAPLASRIPEQSIYISSISKAFYAGLRVSFLAAPKKFYNRICQAIVDTMWMAPPLNAEIASECILDGTADNIIHLKRVELEKRACILKVKLSDYEYRYASGSMFAWLKLPDEWNGSELVKTADENGIHMISSEKFSVGAMVPPNYVRISLCSTDNISDFEKGLDILVKILGHEIGFIGGIL